MFRIQAHILARFRWVKCQVDAIRPLRRAKTIREALKNLPKSLDETYERILLHLIEQNPEEELTLIKRILAFVAFGRQPMSLAELAQAVVIEPYSECLDEDAAFHNPNDLLLLCQPLISASPTTGLLSFVHYSVQEYLVSERLADVANRTQLFALARSDSHVQIAKICLTCLNFNNFAEGQCTSKEAFQNRKAQFPFLEYAASEWPHHAAEDGVESEVSDQILQLLTPQTNSNLATMLQANRDPFFMFRAIRDWRSVDIGDMNDDTVLFFDKGGFIDWDQFEIITMNSVTIAICWGFDSVLRAILQSGANADLPGTTRGNALQTAIYGNQPSAVKILIEEGADINYTPCGRWDTALMAAIRSQRQGIIDYLLEQKADVNIGAGVDHRPLNIAAACNDVPTIECLIALGADIHYGEGNLTSEETPGLALEDTALGMAIEFGSIDAILCLLAKGASLCGNSVVDIANWSCKGTHNNRVQLHEEKALSLQRGLIGLGYDLEIVYSNDTMAMENNREINDGIYPQYPPPQRYQFKPRVDV